MAIKAITRMSPRIVSSLAHLLCPRCDISNETVMRSATLNLCSLCVRITVPAREARQADTGNAPKAALIPAQPLTAVFGAFDSNWSQAYGSVAV